MKIVSHHRTNHGTQRLLLAICALLNFAGVAHALQTLAPAGTPMNVPHNYVWERMTTIGVYSGELVPFVAYQFNTFGVVGGTYTFTMNTTGFPGAINLYQNSFDPNVPAANFWADGVVANAPGTISKSFSIPGNSMFEVVFSAKTNGSSGTFSASASGPANLNFTTTTNVSIRVGPADKTIASGSSAVLRVYAIGPLPHTWQWYSGLSGDTSKPIPGATNMVYGSPPLFNSTSYWVKVTGPPGSGSANSGTADITVTGNPGANFSGSLSPTGCILQNGNLYTVQRFQIQSGGNYNFTVTPGFTLTTYQGVFDSAHPQNNLWGILDGFYAAGTYDLVISKASPGGAFSGSIGNGPAIVGLPAPLPPMFLSSPQDTTIWAMQTAALHVSTTCGTAFTLQWYRGNSGDTNNPIAGATGFTYVTPLLFTNTTYWVRLTHAGGTADSGAATVFVTSGLVGDTGALTECDHKFIRPEAPGQLSGSSVFYKTFVFQVTTDGTYTFSVNGNFNKRVFIYGGAFIPGNPLVNLSYIPLSSPFNAALLSGPNKYYLVIAGDKPLDMGTYDVTVTAGPALVTKSPAPVITTQPVSTNVFRNQQATFNVASPSPSLTYQWYEGTSCANKFPISGANSNSFTTPPVTDWTNYWVELTTPGGYLFSQQVGVAVKPQAFDDNFSTAEDTPLDVAAPAIFANDTKADSRTWTVQNIVQPTHGSVIVEPTGAFVYKPATNYFGPDTFSYQATDGSFDVGATVNINVTPVNDQPIAGPDFLQTTVNTPVSVPMATLLANDIDPDGDPINLVAYSTLSQKGGSAFYKNGIMTYAPPKDFFGTDIFSYTVGDPDGYGGEGYVTVTIPNPELLRLHIAPTPTGYHLWLLGVPGHGYSFQFAPDLAGPWTALKQVDAPVSGMVETDDTADPLVTVRFYRVFEP